MTKVQAQLTIQPFGNQSYQMGLIYEKKNNGRTIDLGFDSIMEQNKLVFYIIVKFCEFYSIISIAVVLRSIFSSRM